ncbi:AMP-binding protein [Nocardioides sp. LML1-1-1.1]
MYLTQSIIRRAQLAPDAPFSIFADRVFSNAATLHRVQCLAGGLQGLGMAHDSNVAVLEVNTDTYLQVALAIAWGDGVIVPVNTRWSVQEIAYSLEEAEVRVLLVGDRFLPLVEQIKAAAPTITTVVHLGEGQTPAGMVPLAELLTADPVPDAERRGDQLMGIFYTGGTTGFPKGVMLSHRGTFLAPLGSSIATEASLGGVGLVISPLFHMGGFGQWIGLLQADGATVPMPDFDPVVFMELVQRHRITGTALAPVMIQMVVDHPERDQYDLSSLETVTYGMAPISMGLLDRARKALPAAQFVQAYGMTELSPTATVLSDEDHDHPVRRASAGRALSFNQVKVVGPDDVELPRGEVGEIVCKGENVMLGYWKKPEETAVALRGGWMHTGDGGYMDEDGYVYVVDRIKDMIITGGENVYSVEVENVVSKHPAVLQCAVIGVPDEKWGERVHAVVELVAGQSLTFEELRAFCKETIAGYKSPLSMEIVDLWPVSATGKILKRELRGQRR